MGHVLGRTRALLALLLTALLTGVALGAAPAATAADTAGISGGVTNWAGVVDGATVTVYRLEGDALAQIATGTTALDGSYVVGSLPAGTYRVHVHDWQADIGEFWNDKDTLETADDIVLADGQVASINVFLSSYTTQRVVANRTPPVITGTPQVGQPLTSTPGTWSPADATVTYYWIVGGVWPQAATGPTYVPTDADVGKTIRVMAAGSYPGWWAGFGHSLPTAPVAAAPPAPPAPPPPPPPPMVVDNTGLPKIKGTFEVGRAVRVTDGTWTPRTVALKYQWYAGSKAIKKATKKKLTLTTKQVGKRLKVKVTASATGYTGLTVATKPSPKVRP
jgi:hypothetical protein